MEYIDIRTVDPYWWVFTGIFVVFSFLVFEGLASMVYLSVYRIIAETMPKQEENEEENKSV